MNIIMTIFSFISMLAIIVAVYLLCKKYIFSKIRINKWIPLSISIVLFAIQIFLGGINSYVTAVISVFAISFFLWFMDIVQTGGPKKKVKQIVIKSKAKPNRVKKDK